MTLSRDCSVEVMKSLAGNITSSDCFFCLFSKRACRWWVPTWYASIRPVA